MASGDSCVQIKAVLPPATLFASLARRVGGSTPAEGVNVWQFDPTASWYLDFLCFLQGLGASAGLTFTLPWISATATTGVTHWNIGIRRLLAGTDDIDASHTYDFNGVDGTAPGSSGMVLYSSIAFTTGADMDSWGNGELAIVRVQRETTHANDNMAGFAQLWGLHGRET